MYMWLLALKIRVLKTTFEEVFGYGHNQANYTGSEYINIGITTSENYVYVYDSVFRDCVSISNGGAICSENVRKFLVEQSSFISCKAMNGYGG
jgi:hypothetical protein